MKLSEEQKDEIRKQLLAGRSIRGVARDCNVSRNTVERIKKSIPPEQVCSQVESNDDDDTHYITNLTKKEEEYAKKIQKNYDLYEDIEEGWVFHLDDGNYRLKTSGLWWNAIVYPESAGKRWKEKLSKQGYSFAVSPLHDKDVWDHDSPKTVDKATGKVYQVGERYKVGDRKKAHYHVIFMFDKRESFQEVNYAIQDICHCPYLQKCRSLKNSFEYFLHINHPKKYQGYDKNEIVMYNGFHLEPNKMEQTVIIQTMTRIILSETISTFDECVNRFVDSPEECMLLTAKSGYFMGIVNSMWHKMHRDEPKKVNVKLVDHFNGDLELEKKPESKQNKKEEV